MSGNDWGKCDKTEPKNNRTRSSVWVRTDRTSLVIDTGPDFRAQVNREEIMHIDAVLYTHAHSDHIDGMNDLRPYWRRQGLAKAGECLPVYSDDATLTEMAIRFDYLFSKKSELYNQMLQGHPIPDDSFYKPYTIGDITFTPFRQVHTPSSLGFRFGDIGYSTDMSGLNEHALEVLKGVKIWIADGANYDFDLALAHANRQQLLELASIIKPEKIYLTHLTALQDYATLSAQLPDGFELAYDGLRLKTTL
jgi:phosphoribosyl 1,2-cyclic phosphate phosphodiesterase